MKYALILDIIQRFYDVAKKDVMIGYHFRFIENFETHIPRIADFWNLQLCGKLENKAHLPFNLLEAHFALGIKRGEMGRWIVLFKTNLDHFEEIDLIKKEDKELFEAKIDLFRLKIEQRIFN